jgi:hypothetical protein
MNHRIGHCASPGHGHWSLDQTNIHTAVESCREWSITHAWSVALELLNEPAIPVNTVTEAGRSTIS